MVVRKFPRYPVAISGTLVQRDKPRCTASVKDLSLKGCRLEGVIKPFAGMQLELLLNLSGEATPIHINKATVRWTGSRGIGVEFSSMAPAEQERLKQAVEQLSATGGQAVIVPKEEAPKT